MSGRRRWIPIATGAALLAAIALVVFATGSSTTSRSTATVPTTVARPTLPAPPAGGANIVFVLTDDLSLNLLRFMPHVRAMERHGVTFANYFVTDSLCCPSRSSIFTGNFPHDTRVFSNFGRDGGFQTFYDRGEERHTFALALQRAGYRTAMMGKYLNGYMSDTAEPADGGRTTVPARYVPPGWWEWDVAGWGYPEFNYRLNHDGTIEHYGDRPRAYLTDVIARKGTAFITDAAHARRPFFLELATFAPHGPYVPAPRNVHDFPGLLAPRPPNFDMLPSHAPRWLAGRRPLTRRQLRTINRVFRLRARSVEAVDAMIAAVERTLTRLGIARNTYIIFSSDNGYHTGEYRLMPGKLTAFDTDIHVPLVVVGPHVAAGVRAPEIVENVDLAETFAAIAGTQLRADGHSLVSLLRGARPPRWRTAALVEHHGPATSHLDPDRQVFANGNPTTYEAMRTPRFLYVEYADGEREYYNLARDPFERHNLAAALTRSRRRRLHRELVTLERCHGPVVCWRAGHVR
jgi:arylsulfatase A-like enzyme